MDNSKLITAVIYITPENTITVTHGETDKDLILTVTGSKAKDVTINTTKEVLNDLVKLINKKL